MPMARASGDQLTHGSISFLDTPMAGKVYNSPRCGRLLSLRNSFLIHLLGMPVYTSSQKEKLVFIIALMVASRPM